MENKKTMILLSGKKGTGKSTVAMSLLGRIEEEPAFIESFARPIKKEMNEKLKKEGYDPFSDKEKIRPLYQHYGEGWRQIDKDHWAKKLLERVEKETEGNVIIVDDLRFENELDYVKNNFNGRVIAIRLEVDDYDKEDNDISEVSFDNYDNWDLKFSRKKDGNHNFNDIIENIERRMYEKN